MVVFAIFLPVGDVLDGFIFAILGDEFLDGIVGCFVEFEVS